VRSLEGRALEEFFATREARRSVQISLLAEVAGSYLTLAADKELLKISRETFESQQASYNLIKRRFEAGPHRSLISARPRRALILPVWISPASRAR